jgi:hypothetical protein
MNYLSILVINKRKNELLTSPDAREKLPIFIGTLERQQEYGLLIKPEPFAPEKLKDIETNNSNLKGKDSETSSE